MTATDHTPTSSHLPTGAHLANVVEGLWHVRLLLASRNHDDHAVAIAKAERLLLALPQSDSRDDGLKQIEAARSGDVDARRELALSLGDVRWKLEGAKEKQGAALRRALKSICFKPRADPSPAKPTRQRKPSLEAALKQANKAGKVVRNATVAPDGTLSIAFGESEPTEANNPWPLDDFKVAKQ